jgi:hypothetical protein
MEKMPITINTLPIVPLQNPNKSRTVQGRIVDQDGKPLVGVSISQKGTQQGAITNINGMFTLTTNNNNPLEARYSGFDSKVFSVDTSTPILVAMTESRQTSDENNTKEKTDLAGSSQVPDEKPSPLMGMKSYQRYIKQNMKYPTDAVCRDKKGTVVLEFSVDSKGIPVNIYVKKSVCVSMDIEAIRLLQQGPKWTAGSRITELKVKF